MDIIVAVTQDWGIGCKGQLLFSIPDDMKYFRETTKGAVVLMGRETLESFPGKRPLKNRVNVVLSRNNSLQIEGAICISDISMLPPILAEHREKNIFVIGGESVYRQMLPYCRQAYVTKMATTLPADKFFPDLDADPSWRLMKKGTPKEYEGVAYEFDIYENSRVKSI